MPDLVVIFGPPASGKAAIGAALCERTGFRLFHNHMTAEPVAALFGWGTRQFTQRAAELRLLLLSRMLELRRPPAGIVFTFMWAHDLEQDNLFIAELVDMFASHGGRVCFVELLASRKARKAREGTPLRLSLKPSKRDVPEARALHDAIDAKHQLNSRGDFPYPQHHLVVDTERHSPKQAAALIADRFGFAAGKAKAAARRSSPPARSRPRAN